MTDLFEILMTDFTKFYSRYERVVVDEVVVKFKGRIIFKQYISKKHKHLVIKMYKVCDSSGYICDVDICLCKDREWIVQHLTATHTTVTNLTRRVGGGPKLYVDNFFSSPDLFYNLAQNIIYCCETK